jgi:hypothetical protein
MLTRMPDTKTENVLKVIYTKVQRQTAAAAMLITKSLFFIPLWQLLLTHGRFCIVPELLIVSEVKVE